MVGNDVVDLHDPESNPETLHPRFDTRVFTPLERQMIEESSEASRLRWRLWAAKEAVYKLVKKSDATTIFSPPSFSVTGLAGEAEAAAPPSASVEHGGARYHVRFVENDSALHAIATRAEDSQRELLSGWRQLATGEIAAGDPYAPSEAVRDLLCEQLSAHLGLPKSEFEVRRRGRVPELWWRGAPAPADLSLSHHGGWLGFACRVDAARFSRESS